MNTLISKISSKHLIPLFLLVPFLGSGLSMAGNEAIKVIPVISVKTTENGVDILYRLPCGGTYKGLVATQKANQVRVGVAFQMNAYRCTTVPEVSTEHIYWIDRKLKLKLSPIAKSPAKGIWKRAGINLVNSQVIGRRQKKRTKLDIIYMSRCGIRTLPLFHSDRQGLKALSSAGALNQLNNRKNQKFSESFAAANDLEVTVLEFFPKKRRTKCQTQERQISFRRLVNPDLGLKLVSRKKNPKGFDQQFRVRMASVEKDTIRRMDRRGISVEYKRRCDESPIGLVVTPVKNSKNKPGTKVIGLGVLVAQYYNFDCNLADSDKLIQSKFALETISLPEKSILKRLKPIGFDEPLRLRSPVVSDFMKKGKKMGIVLDYMGDCSRTIGAIYSVDSKGNTAVGALEKNLDRSCKYGLKRVSLQQPYLKQSDRKYKKVYSLRVKGLSQI